MRSCFTVPELLSIRAAADPQRTALIVEQAGSITFGAWDKWSNAVARELTGRGLRAGDRVGLIFGEGEWIEFAVAFCAVGRAGGVAVPISDRLAEGTVRQIMHDCSMSAILHGRDARFAAWTAAVPLHMPVADRSGDTSPVRCQARPGDLAQILYTSGTTARPKGVSASHANLTFGCQADSPRRKLAHSTHFVHAFPIGTNAGQTMLINALDTRPAAVTLPRFTPERFARLIAAYRAGTVFLVPAMAIELLNAGVHERHDLSSVLLLGSAASCLPPAVAAGLAAAFPNATIVNYYTSTEAAPAQTVMVVDVSRPESVGRPALGSGVKIVNSAGQRAAPGETGEVWLRSAAESRAYYGDPSASGQVFRDGWVRMGDLGYLDAHGYLYLVDRESDVIKSAAFKVSTLQVEAALYEHPAVAEAAVFGVPHQVLGMAVGAAVVTRSEVTAGELRAFLSGRLAGHEVPSRLLFLDSLPKNQAGKVLKRELRDLAGTREAG
jgi:acyl-CoA synthetase (AMP-forming)/AMP-acid ligase II